MDLLAQLNKDMIVAMKAKNEIKLSVIRMAKTLITNKEKELRGPIVTGEIEKILQTMIKQRKDSAEAFTKGNRLELAAKELDEIKIIETYLPKQMIDEELAYLIAGVTIKLPRDSKDRNMGFLMKAVNGRAAELGVRIDGKQASQMIKDYLSGPPSGIINVDDWQVQ